MKPQHYITRLRWFVMLVFLFGIPLFLYALIQAQRQNRPDDSEKYIITLSQTLNSNWQVKSIERDRKDNLNDLRGFDFAIIGRTTRITRNINEPLSFIEQTVIVYGNTGAAQRRYGDQEKWIFDEGFGYGYKWQNMDQINDSLIKADKVHLACTNFTTIENLNNTECISLVLVGRYIAYTNMYPTRNSKTYLSKDEIAKIVDVIAQGLPKE